MALSTLVVSGASLSEHLAQVADLRLKVFAEYPYLYHGSKEEERRYLSVYEACADSLFVLSVYDGQLVGVSTCIPLAHAHDEVKRPFMDAQIPIESVLYLGESLLLPGYRGQGIYKRFFEERQAHGVRLPRISHCFFCAVERPADDPRRPRDYRPLASIWEHFGYTRREDLRTEFSWRDIGDSAPTKKSMFFWGKRL